MKKQKVMDLEFLMPSEFKEEAGVELVAPEPMLQMDEESIASSEACQEVCHSCGRDSHEALLTCAFHQGRQKLICTECLRHMMNIGAEPIRAESYGLGECAAQTSRLGGRNRNLDGLEGIQDSSLDFLDGPKESADVRSAIPESNGTASVQGKPSGCNQEDREEGQNPSGMSMFD